MKLHLGCGDVYLEGYVNIDIYIEGYSFLAADRPGLVRLNRTTEDNYYKKPYPGAGGFAYECAADRFLDFTYLPYPDGSVEKILAVQCLEHLTPEEARKAVAEWHRVLAPGATAVIDVPDFEQLAAKLLEHTHEEYKEYYYTMIFGSHKNVAASHKDGYSREKLALLLLDAGFHYVYYLKNIFNHPYPAVTVEAIKGGRRVE